ncbi:MAG: tetratricopeptide repeat protein [Sandaracinaceae bacterium]
MRLAGWALVGLCMWLAPGRADAQDEDNEVAAELRAQGQAALRQGRFDEALSAFQQAAFQSRDPRIWLEVGDAADRLRQNDAALDAYRRYLTAAPNADDRAEVAARVAVLQAVVGAGRARPLLGEAQRRGLMPTMPTAPRARIGEAGRRSIIPAAEIVDAIRRGRAGRRLTAP